MLIAIFVLLLIAVVGITLILSSGTETALAGNYRSSMEAHYAALAGLEEARGRLLPTSPNSLSASFTLPLPVGQVYYITNPANGENVLTTYPDGEYHNEFDPGSSNVNPPIASVSEVPGAEIPGQPYRWVRINAVTEKSLNIDVGNDSWNDKGNPKPIYYDGARLTLTPTPAQALEITSLAVLPNGTQKLLQYIVAPIGSNLTFPAALTLDGDSPTFNPGSTQFPVNGNDQGSPPITPCPASPGPSVTAIGYTGSDTSNITTTPPGPGNYPGVGGVPSVNSVSLPPSLQTLNGLNALVQSISQSADVKLTAPVTGSVVASQMPTNTSATNPQTVFVNGDLDLTGWTLTGYGILLVTGNLTYDPGASWEGIVLVIGKGKIVSKFDGSGGFDGAVFVARTLDASNNPLDPPGPRAPSVTVSTGNGGNGIRYNSCWVRAVQKPTSYKVLSFREIPQ